MIGRDKVIQRMIEVEFARNASEAEIRLQSESIPAFGKTGGGLVEEGYADALLDGLESVSDGGYA